MKYITLLRQQDDASVLEARSYMQKRLLSDRPDGVKIISAMETIGTYQCVVIWETSSTVTADSYFRLLSQRSDLFTVETMQAWDIKENS